jgi:hypothetical protein
MSYACRHQIAGAQEQLNRNIIHLGEKMDLLRNRNVEKSSTFHQWKKRWSEEKSMMEKHFESIEEKLSNLKSTRKVTPKLSIYDVPPDSDGMRTMRSF